MRLKAPSAESRGAFWLLISFIDRRNFKIDTEFSTGLKINKECNSKVRHGKEAKRKWAGARTGSQKLQNIALFRNRETVKKEPGNVLKLERSKYDAWHDLFGNKTLDEIIAYLKRLQDEQEEWLLDKRYQLRKESVVPLPELRNSSFDPYDVLGMPVRKHFSWQMLFGNRDIEEAISCLEMVNMISKERMREGIGRSISVAMFV